jgi:hypothetical protein
LLLEALDVVIRDEKRVFVPAGQTEGGIARSAIFDRSTIEWNPGQAGQVRVTLSVPEQPTVRAVVALFYRQTAIPGNGSLMVRGSLGTLITYNLSSDVAVAVDKPAVTPQTETSNLSVSQGLKNTGSEPVVPHGTLAILDDRWTTFSPSPLRWAMANPKRLASRCRRFGLWREQCNHTMPPKESTSQSQTQSCGSKN